MTNGLCSRGSNIWSVKNCRCTNSSPACEDHGRGVFPSRSLTLKMQWKQVWESRTKYFYFTGMTWDQVKQICFLNDGNVDEPLNKQRCRCFESSNTWLLIVSRHLLNSTHSITWPLIKRTAHRWVVALQSISLYLKHIFMMFECVSVALMISWSSAGERRIKKKHYHNKACYWTMWTICDSPPLPMWPIWEIVSSWRDRLHGRPWFAELPLLKQRPLIKLKGTCWV